MRKCSMCKQGRDNTEFAKPIGGFFKCCEKCRIYSREYSKQYREMFPEKRKETIRCAHKKYRSKPENRAKEKIWRQSETGRISRSQTKKKYRSTEHGKRTENINRARRQEQYRKKHQQRYKARIAVNNALRDGKIIKPSVCQICGCEGKLHAHHFKGWENTFDIWWVCDGCEPPFYGKLPHDGSLSLEKAKVLVGLPICVD